jgi:hypothetical protein
MRKLFFSLLFILFFKGYSDSLYVSPSFYFTFGNYTDNNDSKSFAFYNSLQLSQRYYLINGYDNLSIKADSWKYHQQFFLGGVFVNYFPFYFKFNYAHIKGDFKLNDIPDFNEASSNYSDYSNLFNLDLIYYQDLFYYGTSLTYFHAIGKVTKDLLTSQSVGQLTFRLEYIPTPDIFLSLKPNYTFCKDGRKLYSLALKGHYLLSANFLVKTGGQIGERAYYFDSDLLTIFNQPQTQKFQAFLQLEYFPSIFWKFTLAYQNTKFETYSINYFTIGFKTGIEY